MLLAGSALAVHGQIAEQERSSVKTLWVKGFELFDQAETLAGAGESAVASRRFAEALSKFEEISRRQPDWNPNLVKYRIDICRTRIADLSKALAIPPMDTFADGMAEPSDSPLVLSQDLDSISMLAKENATLKAENSTLNQELTRLRNKEQAFTELALQTTQVDALNRTLRKQIEVANARCEQAERERKNALDAQAGFLQKIADQNNALSEARKQNLDLAEAVAQIPVLREKAEQCDRLTELAVGLQRQREADQADIEALRQAIAALEAEGAPLREQLAESALRLEQAEAVRSVAEGKCAELLQQVTDLTRQQQETAAHLLVRETELADLQAAREQAESAPAENGDVPVEQQQQP
jgi:DNA repair exonuclease SbcCD ATPase subunit